MATHDPSYYQACLEEMFALGRFGIVLGLETSQKLLAQLGNPHRAFSGIHIAGTNGKGSIASTLANIFHICGYKVGLYTSPHLVKFNERIQINGVPISDEEVVESYLKIKHLDHGNRQPTFFEYTTAMALYEFARHKVDWAVIETGMGGRLDATNILSPQMSIISNLSLEHRQYLGHTISQIAREKGGIIKDKIPVVTGVTQKKALQTLDDIARLKKSPIYHLGQAFKVRKNKKQNTFNYYGMDHHWPDMATGLLGNYQIDNAAVVIAACELLQKKHPKITLANIKEGLLTNKWPGRLETVSTSPLVIIDGAHNLIAARNLAKYLKINLAHQKITLVIGILSDKPYQSILKSLVPHCHRVIFTRPKIDRNMDPRVLARISKAMNTNQHIIDDVGEAFKYAVESTAEGDAVCVAGSLYVVGEAKEAIEKGIVPLKKTHLQSTTAHPDMK